LQTPSMASVPRAGLAAATRVLNSVPRAKGLTPLRLWGTTCGNLREPLLPLPWVMGGKKGLTVSPCQGPMIGMSYLGDKMKRGEIKPSETSSALSLEKQGAKQGASLQSCVGGLQNPGTAGPNSSSGKKDRSRPFVQV
jgi:hypothetical protein